MKTLWSQPIYCAEVLFGLSFFRFFLFFRFQCETNLFPLQPIGLASSSPPPGTEAWVGGWGLDGRFPSEVSFLFTFWRCGSTLQLTRMSEHFFVNNSPGQHLDGNKTDQQLCPFARWSHFQIALQLIKRVRGNMYYTTSASTLHVQRSHSQKAWALFH